MEIESFNQKNNDIKDTKEKKDLESLKNFFMENDNNASKNYDSTNQYYYIVENEDVVKLPLIDPQNNHLLTSLLNQYIPSLESNTEPSLHKQINDNFSDNNNNNDNNDNNNNDNNDNYNNDNTNNIKLNKSIEYLKHILNENKKIKPCHHYDTVIEIIDNQQNNILNKVSNFIYNDLILCLLNHFRNQKPLSQTQLQELIINNKSKLKVEKDMYEKAIHVNNYMALGILLDHDLSDLDTLFCQINKYCMLEKAVTTNNYKLAKIVLSYDTYSFKDITFKTYLSIAKEAKNRHLMKLLTKASLSNSLEMVPTQKTSVSTSRPLYNPSHINYVLNLIIRIGDLPLVKYLVEDKEFKDSVQLNTPDINQEYPLLSAFYYNQLEIFKYLIKRGADVNIRGKGNSHSLLFTALDQENGISFIKCILQQPINVTNPKDEDSKPLDINDTYPVIKAIY